MENIAEYLMVRTALTEARAHAAEKGTAKNAKADSSASIRAN
jgi:hypothetical protein